MSQVTINSTDLKAVCGRLSKIIRNECITTIMESCLVQVDDGKATFVGLDIQYAIETTAPALHTEPVGIAIHFKELKEMADAVPPDVPVQFRFVLHSKGDGADIHIECGRANFDLPGNNPSVFPRLPNSDGAIRYELPAGLMSEFNTSAEFQAANDEPKFQGTTLLFSDEQARVFACDRGSLFRSKAYEAAGISDTSVIMPAKISDMFSILKNDGATTLRFGNGSWAALITNNSTRHCRLIDDHAVPYDQILAIPVPHTFSMDAVDMSTALRVATVGISGSKDRVVMLKVSPDKINVEASTHDKGKKAATVVDLANSDGSAFDIKFSPEVLAKCVKRLAFTCTVKHGGNNMRHFMFSDEESDALYLAMPMS